MVKNAVFAAVVAAASVNAFAHEGLGFDVPREERRMNAPFFENLEKRYGAAPARVLDRNMMGKRQTVAAATTSAASAASAAASTVAAGAAATSVAMGTIPIGTTTTLQATSPLPSTPVAGASAPVSGAPVLPNVVIDPSQWPALDKTPPTNSTQVQQWISQIDWSKVPNIAVNQLGGCSNASNAAALQAAQQNGWWTCGQHTRSSDVTYCPQKNTWGLSYDDGPSPDTPRLLNYMTQQNIKSTFFVVGSRVISRPQMLQYEYMAGNQISVHTWEHPYLTTKTNEEIVASLGWTKYAIKQVLGVTPNTFRPPYGDIDDRVRAIALQMGLTPIIWTSVNGTSFDTFDWEIAGGVVNADTVLAKFESIINNSTKLGTGFIVLAHDLYQQSTSLAVDYVLPYALSRTNPKLTLQPIFQCLGQSFADSFIETASNKSGAAVTSTVDRNSSAPTSAIAGNAAAASTSTKSGAMSALATPALAGLVAAALGVLAFSA